LIANPFLLWQIPDLPKLRDYQRVHASQGVIANAQPFLQS
jgi:hypothetical protein